MNHNTIDRISPTRRPAEKPVGHQSWRDLFFLHWSVPVDLLRAAVPAPLVLDLYEDQAWLGIVPFKMRDVRPAWSPVVPLLSHFLETNVRTYVHYNGEPGVWFFSLDANATIATLIARYRWNLNYCRGNLSLKEQGHTFHWSGQRLWPSQSDVPAHYDIQTETDPAFTPCRTAEPDTFEHFLVERYLLFTRTKNGKLLRGQVHHDPYPFQTAQVAKYTGTLETQLGLPELDPRPQHALYSRGVDVDMFALREV